MMNYRSKRNENLAQELCSILNFNLASLKRREFSRGSGER